MSHPVILSAANFEQEVIKSDKPVLVDFWAEWCGPCRMLIPVLEEFAEKHGDKVKVAKLDVNDPAHGELAEKYEVQGIPAMRVFKGGSVVKEMVGFRPIETLTDDMAEFLK